MTKEPTASTSPGVYRRFGCYCLDRGFAWVIVYTGVVIYSAIANIPWEVYGNFYARSMIALILLVAALTVFHACGGQSPGKIVGYLKVVKLDGSGITLVQSLARALFSYGIEILLLWIYFTAKEQNPLFLIASVLWLAIDAAFLLSDREQRRALHDIVAGTRVVSLVGTAGNCGESE